LPDYKMVELTGKSTVPPFSLTFQRLFSAPVTGLAVSWDTDWCLRLRRCCDIRGCRRDSGDQIMERGM